MRYLFEEYTFDTSLRELRRGAEVVFVAPQVFDVLDYLIRNRERVVSKDDLINAVWNGRIVSDSALTTRLNAARSAIGDTGEEQRLIKTLPRKGFRFIGSVQEMRGPATHFGVLSEHSHNPPTLTSPPRLSIVVLPFSNLSGDQGQDYFVDGVTESLTTDLSRISGSFVIGRHTAFTYKGKAADLKQIGRELNVRYVLEGSVQRSSNRLRVNVQLVDTESGNHLWAERFDKPIADLFDMQDEIVSRLANSLDAQLVEAEARRAERSLHPDAMELYFQGMACFNKGRTAEYTTRARGFFERALALDPKNVEALVTMAEVDEATGTSFLADDRAARFAAAETALIKALSLAPQHARAHWLLGRVKMFTNRAVQGIADCEQALALDRNLANAHGEIGHAKYFLGRGAETEAHVQEALRLSPRDTDAFVWMMFAGLAKLQIGADDEAVVRFLRSVEINRNHPRTHFFLAAALAHLGRLDEARSAVQAGLTLNPNFTIRRFRAGALGDHPTYLAGRERTYEGLRMAGVPKG
ncbi:winged helix-turn-helix domain-containing tetratricopeptide repeat protein [Bradyrhizobium sp. Arg816]|uniref:winged helix-turn-helix domain-containing tetratricopeptide repeat protein n=1 Tax=Bradyrhizobium sp. Arg816 TaxID=2998491 RepID=UPI00249DD559|nr:winged helix-turn-helix domain-containing protein [Bradyrhizobium sp. Arg816]MDI3561389.1 winged helix-turn-helix domain-containing protein [Bradyrhizobium sp. Arg816]